MTSTGWFTHPAAAATLAQFGGGEAGVLDLFRQLGAMGWLVALTLLGFSIVSWSVMLGKIVQFRRAESQNNSFLEVFRRSQRFSEVGAAGDRFPAAPLVGLFRSGYVEIDTQVKAMRERSGDEAGYRIKSLHAVERSLRRAAGVEVGNLGRGAAFLATTAAAAPFIGLFGTVWGIMIAFQDIGASGNTSLVAVAPGIAEALINTALGLGAAIPALIGYNYIAARLRRFRSQMDDFILEMINLAERNFT